MGLEKDSASEFDPTMTESKSKSKKRVLFPIACILILMMTLLVYQYMSSIDVKQQLVAMQEELDSLDDRLMLKQQQPGILYFVAYIFFYAS